MTGNTSRAPVSREMVMKCLEAARLAPSACNSQPWKFVVVDDVALLPQMGAAAAGMGMNGFAREVPVIVAVVLEKMNLTARIGSVIKDKEYSLLDVGIAVEHFCLQAAELGLGTCIMGWFDEKESEKSCSASKESAYLCSSRWAIRRGRPARKRASRWRR